MSDKQALLTSGYSGCDPESFVAKLRQHGVEVVVDVRQNPISRKKGFSRAKLSEFLGNHDIEYVHEGKLGVPPRLRQQLKEGSRPLSSYFVHFREYLDQCGSELDRVYELATRKRCCLICLELLAKDCHRSVVAEAVEGRNGHKLRVVHI